MFWFTLWLAFGVSIAEAQVKQKLPAGKQLVVREVCQVDAPLEYMRNGMLSFDGKELIVVAPNKKLSLYNVKDLKERVVLASPLIVNAWSDSAMGGIFVMLVSENHAAEQAKKLGKRDQPFYDLLHFENETALADGKAKWKKEGVGREPAIQWICGAKLFCLRPFGNEDSNCILLDAAGNEVSNFKSPGIIYAGLDTLNDEIEVYYQPKSTPYSFIMRGVLDSKYEKVTRMQRALPSQFSNLSLTPMDMRVIRLRGLKSGDVRRFIEWTNQPLHSQHAEHENIGLDPIHVLALRRKDAGFPRWGERGVLSFAESPKDYSIVPSVPANTNNRNFPPIDRDFPPFVYRRSGELIVLHKDTDPFQPCVQDAVLSDDTWVVSLYQQSMVSKSQYVTTFSVCTLEN